MVYETRIQTRAKIQSNPPGLEMFLPPLPTELSTRQRATLTVQRVQPDGAADVEARLDEFELQSNLLERIPENLKESTRRGQEEFVRKVRGLTLAVHFDGDGKLLGFEGADSILELLEAPLREPVRQALKFYLEQLGGSSVSPGHSVKPGEDWKRKMGAQPLGPFPFAVGGESRLRYSGQEKYRGIKAGAVDINFENVLTPEPASLGKAAPLAQLEARGIKVDLRVDGNGSGRMLVALDDGRVLENRTTVRQVLSADLQGPPSASSPAAGPLMLKIETETVIEHNELSP